MPKVSVVMPVYNASRFLNDSVNSILNQTLDDLELICVDDGSTDDSLSILNSFEDPRIKVYSRDHQGGGNARNFGLSKITGKYLFCMDADDILDLNAFEEFYKISEEKDLDFIVFKAINYGVEKDHYFETEYQNMTRIYDKVKDNVFSYKDLGDLLFDFNVSPWCKFYNSEFVKNTGAKFRENSKFHDNQFFWDIIFKAERIYFIDEFYYTRKRYDQSLTASGDRGHIDIIDVVNDIIQLFIKHNQLDNYKRQLYNLKITWITDRYNQIQERFKEDFFRKMKNDYLSSKRKEFPNLLDEDKRFIYDCVIIAKNYDDFDLINHYYSITKNRIDELNENNLKNKKTIDELNNQLKGNEKVITGKNNIIQNNEQTINQLNNQINENNNTIQNKTNTINNLNNQLKNNEQTINQLNNQIDKNNNTIQNKTNTINDLNNQLKNNEQTINQLNNQINENNNTIQNKTNTINNLNNQLKDNEQTINQLNNQIDKNNNTIQNKTKTIEKLNKIVENKFKTIDGLNSQLNNQNEMIKRNTIKISKLEIENMNLTKRNDYLKNELESKFSFKKFLKRYK